MEEEAKERHEQVGHTSPENLKPEAVNLQVVSCDTEEDNLPATESKLIKQVDLRSRLPEQQE